MTTGRNVPLLTAIVASAVALGLLAVHLWVQPVAALTTFESLAIDARFKLRGPRAPATDRVVVIGIDDATRRQFPDIIQTRRGYARLITALSRYDVKVIALDMFFDAPEVILPPELERKVRETDDELAVVRAALDPPPLDRLPIPGAPVTAEQTRDRLALLLHDIAEELRGDEVLARAIGDSKRVFLGAYFRKGTGQARDAEPPLLELARFGESADSNAGGDLRPVHAVAVDFTLPAVGKGAVGAGALNTLPDADGVTRRMPLATELGGRHYLPIGLTVALHELGKTGDTAYLAGQATLRAGGRTLPVGHAASLTLDVLGRGRLPFVSAADVLSGRAEGSALAGKLAFVGLTYGAYDEVQTALDPRAKGVELHATLAENFLGNRILGTTGPLASLLAGLALCGVVIAAQLRRVRRRAWVPPVVALLAFGGYLAVAQLLFVQGTLVGVAAPIAAASLVLAAATIGGLATEGREKAHLRAVFSQYVSRSVVDRILADPARARLGGERKVLTVLFSDIRGFSAFSEAMGPEALASFLGEYLTPMTDLVLESGGTLDKYIGDAVMAIWAAPIDVPDHAARACEVALRMQEALVGLNRRWKAQGKPEVAIGIGINTGPMSVGNMGTPARFDYTVLGDQVNLGARLEALTKEYGVDILVGEETARAAGARFVFREVDLVRVKGRAGAAPVFHLVGRAGVRVDPRFGEALAAYRRREFATAQDGFSALAGDPTAAILARRCAALVASPPPADWDGVYDQRSK